MDHDHEKHVGDNSPTGEKHAIADIDDDQARYMAKQNELQQSLKGRHMQMIAMYVQCAVMLRASINMS